MRIAIILIFISIQAAGIFFGTKIAFGDDLQVSFENEIAGITPGMTILPKTTGNLDQPDSQIAKAWNSNPTQLRKGKLPVNRYAGAGFISKKMVPVGKVVKIFDNRLATNGPERVFIDLGRRQGLELGDKFTVYSQGRFIYHPVLGQKRELWSSHPTTKKPGFPSRGLWSIKGKPLGYRIEILGVLEVVKVGDNGSYARVIKAHEDIQPGDFFIPFQEIVEPPSVNNRGGLIEGFIVATNKDKISVAFPDIVYIDKGWEDGVRSGNIFEIYEIPEVLEEPWYQVGSFGLRKTQYPPDVLGEIRVVNTQKHTATAVIVQNNYDMHVGNRIRSKR